MVIEVRDKRFVLGNFRPSEKALNKLESLIADAIDLLCLQGEGYYLNIDGQDIVFQDTLDLLKNENQGYLPLQDYNLYYLSGHYLDLVSYHEIFNVYGENSRIIPKLVTRKEMTELLNHIKWLLGRW